MMNELALFGGAGGGILGSRLIVNLEHANLERMEKRRITKQREVER